MGGGICDRRRPPLGWPMPITAFIFGSGAIVGGGLACAAAGVPFATFPPPRCEDVDGTRFPTVDDPNGTRPPPAEDCIGVAFAFAEVRVTEPVLSLCRLSELCTDDGVAARFRDGTVEDGPGVVARAGIDFGGAATGF